MIIYVFVIVICVGLLIYLHQQSEKRKDKILFDKLFEIVNNYNLTKNERYLKMVRLCMDTKGRVSMGAYMGIEAFNSLKDK